MSTAAPATAQTVVSSPENTIAPYRTGGPKRWEGSAPWRDKLVSVILPVLEYNATLDLTLECLRRQTYKPLIFIIDTGSVATTDRLLALRDASTEVIQLRLQGWFHPSWPVAAALDTAWNCINTPFAFFTHDDCFLKQQWTLEHFVTLARRHQVVGHQITERPYAGWEQEFGHTCLMMDVAEMDRIGLTWNMRAYCHLSGRSIDPQVCKQNDPDTETMMNYQLRKAGLIPSFATTGNAPLFLGTEENYVRNNNEWFDHCRSMTCSFLYSPAIYAKNLEWTKAAMTDCRARLKTWT